MSPRTSESNVLFVFGYCSRDMDHFRKIQPHVIDSRTAVVRGTVYRLTSGMPVFSSKGIQPVVGEIVTLSKPSLLFALLDEFHGVHPSEPDRGLFLREEIEARLENDVRVPTQAYSINTLRLPRGAKVVEDADWRKSLQERPTLISRLTDRQKSYIQKLGASSGRDIVPIDLTLYRELMHMEIVIDKGRRLALTPLGQELFRFLS